MYQDIFEQICLFFKKKYTWSLFLNYGAKLKE